MEHTVRYRRPQPIQLDFGLFPWTIGGDAFLVYSYLCRCASGGNGAFPSLRTIGANCFAEMENVDSSRRRSIRALKRLEEEGFVTIEHRQNEDGSFKSSLYYIEEVHKTKGVTENPYPRDTVSPPHKSSVKVVKSANPPPARLSDESERGGVGTQCHPTKALRYTKEKQPAFLDLNTEERAPADPEDEEERRRAMKAARAYFDSCFKAPRGAPPGKETDGL